MFFVNFFFFFFQAEDGIRDAQESRGLGDVYKRQVLMETVAVMGRDWESVMGMDIVVVNERVAVTDAVGGGAMVSVIVSDIVLMRVWVVVIGSDLVCGWVAVGGRVKVCVDGSVFVLGEVKVLPVLEWVAVLGCVDEF
eukprot:TRINITY_DN29435_c0_g1_i2.p2 TRINITY_DN29435_c0_g1~~TRINITY_DN29435_c0_g1_i2.p2  ORF type:complete len:138 (-),score=34.29 TRINITY_DN29435_c0_g1_i2:191-604(-)